MSRPEWVDRVAAVWGEPSIAHGGDGVKMDGARWRTWSWLSRPGADIQMYAVVEVIERLWASGSRWEVSVRSDECCVILDGIRTVEKRDELLLKALEMAGIPLGESRYRQFADMPQVTRMEGR